MKTGVLVFNLGGPETLRDVKPFLYRLFSDPAILRIRWKPLRCLAAYAIATLRRRTSERYYAQIGGGSPLRRLTDDQAVALRDELRRRGMDASTYVGMCTWKPFLNEAIDQLVHSENERAVILPLFPHFSVTTTGSGFAILKRLMAERPKFNTMDVRWVQAFPDHPGYIQSLVEVIRRELRKFNDPARTHLLFSAHSIPEKYIREGDPYLEHVTQSVELIMDGLGRTSPYRLSFQSKIGPVKWLSPMTNDVIVELGRQGIDDVLVVPISFVSEHIETLYELDILYKKVASDAGVANFRRVPALNNDPLFIHALADIVETVLQ